MRSREELLKLKAHLIGSIASRETVVLELILEVLLDIRDSIIVPDKNLNEKLWQLNKQIMEQNQRLFIENMKFHESLRDGFKPEGRTE